MVKHYVRWRHITPELYMTPLMHISIDHTVVETETVNPTDMEISIAVAKEFENLNINPDHVRIESRQVYQWPAEPEECTHPRTYDAVRHESGMRIVKCSVCNKRVS